MVASEPAGLLAGFVLGHAAWSVSDLPAGELLVPMAMVDNSGERRLVRFESETQERAIAEGKKFVSEQQAASSAWALAREGQINSGNGPVDVLLIDVWAYGMEDPITFIQPFQPFAAGEFKLLGPAVPVVDGAMLDEAESQPYLEFLYRGVSSHGKAAELWPTWQ